VHFDLGRIVLIKEAR